jgi:hypothetical protein
LPQAKTVHRRGIKPGEVPKCRGDETDLRHIGTAIGARREMQADPDFGQDGKAVVQILGDPIRDIAASQSTMNPL